MRKLGLLLLAAAFAVSPAAFAKSKAKHQAKVDPAVAAEKMDKNEASYRFVRDALPLALPSWALPIYFSMQKDKKP
jgi:hypothetical protein